MLSAVEKGNENAEVTTTLGTGQDNDLLQQLRISRWDGWNYCGFHLVACKSAAFKNFLADVFHLTLQQQLGKPQMACIKPLLLGNNRVAIVFLTDIWHFNWMENTKVHIKMLQSSKITLRIWKKCILICGFYYLRITLINLIFLDTHFLISQMRTLAKNLSCSVTLQVQDIKINLVRE